VGDPQKPKDECEKFLERQKPWVRAVLQSEPGSTDILPPLAALGGIEALSKAQDDYEELLKHCPRHLREYRRRTEANAKQSARATLQHLGPVKAGRPPSREVQERGKRAARLFDKGLTGGQVAQRLCDRKSEPRHRCSKRCADRIRQRAKPYLESKQMRENSH
jgi:hypothetical protein